MKLKFFVFLALGSLSLFVLPTTGIAAAPNLVIFDNDFAGPGDGGADILIASPDIKVLGLTVVTGDGWRDEETSLILRFLEIAGAKDIPVYNGAVYPLINSYTRMLAWEKAYGKIPWKGAWNTADFGLGFHPTDPWKIPATPDGPPKIKASSQSAVDFLIHAVHQYPHQITILAAGPLTNLALAIRQDPEFAGLAKELIFMGAILDTNLLQVTGSANFNTDFNFIFDPEAAHITLTAAWPKIVAVGGVGNSVVMTEQLIDRLKALKTPVAQYISGHAQKDLPLWDELAAAIVVDPSLVTKQVEANMDVDLDHGINYGQAHLWPDSTKPHQGERKVSVVLSVDQKRFATQLIRSSETSYSQK